jgi:hypothetical protein
MSMTVILKQMPPQVLADIRASGSLDEFLAKFELVNDAQEVKNPE